MLRLGLALAAAAIILDQLTKWLAYDALWNPPQRLVVTGFFWLTPVENRGVSFGLFQADGGFGRWAIVIFAVVVSIGLGVWLWRSKRRWLAGALGLVIGGALGNVIDRVRFGWVIDFIDVHAGGYHWPAFNVADSAIVVGIAMLLLDSLIGPKKEPR